MDADALLSLLTAACGVALVLGAAVVVLRSQLSKTTAQLLREENAAQQNAIDRLREENDELARRVDNLEEERDALRRVASGEEAVRTFAGELWPRLDQIDATLSHLAGRIAATANHGGTS